MRVYVLKQDLGSGPEIIGVYSELAKAFDSLPVNIQRTWKTMDDWWYTDVMDAAGRLQTPYEVWRYVLDAELNHSDDNL